MQDRTVYQMMGNYQAAGQEGGSGYMRFLQVDEGEGVIRSIAIPPCWRITAITIPLAPRMKNMPWTRTGSTSSSPFPGGFIVPGWESMG